MTDHFVTDVVLESKDICNLVQDFEFLKANVVEGKRVIFAGPRNTGKTSLVHSKLLPWFLANQKNSLGVFVDLMGVTSFDEINRLFTRAFENAYAHAKPAKSFLNRVLKIAVQSRPTFSMDPLTNDMSFSFTTDPSSSVQEFESILKILDEYHKTYSALLIIDEFQDIAFVKQGEARMRGALQKLSGNLPVVVLGSKKHLLANIFARPKAPLAGWGQYQEISRITAEDFLPYINERLKSFKLKLTLKQTQFLLEKMNYVPEAVNLVCDHLRRRGGSPLSELSITQAIVATVEARAPVFKEALYRYTENERIFLRELAMIQPLQTPYANHFQRRIGMSTGASRPILKRLEDDGLIVRETAGYQVGDPLLAEFLRRS